MAAAVEVAVSTIVAVVVSATIVIVLAIGGRLGIVAVAAVALAPVCNGR